MKDYCYSNNDEYYGFSDEYEAIRDIIKSGKQKVAVGVIVTIFRGEKIRCSASEFSPRIVELMADAAANEAPDEVCGDWPNSTIEQDDELQKAIDGVIDAWAEKHNLTPNFFHVKNTKELKFQITKFCDESNDFDYIGFS